MNPRKCDFQELMIELSDCIDAKFMANFSNKWIMINDWIFGG
jgi:hypothetical protein